MTVRRWERREACLSELLAIFGHFNSVRDMTVKLENSARFGDAERRMVRPTIQFSGALTDLEDHFWREDGPDYPMVIVLVTHLEGALDSVAFQDALAEVLPHNPLLNSVVEQRGWLSRWRLADNSPQISVVPCDGDPPTACQPTRIDLKTEPGLKCELRVGPDRSVLVTWFHHACVDGLGAIRFLGNVFARYGQITATADDVSPTIRLPDPAKLAYRGSRKAPDLTNRRPPLIHRSVITRDLLFQKCYRIHGANSDDAQLESPADAANMLHTQTLPRSVIVRLKKVAASLQVTQNDLCMMAYLQELVAFSDASEDAKESDRFRILMPISMRTMQHDGISAANVITYGFHVYTRAEIRDSHGLLRKVHARTEAMIKHNEGAVMLDGLAIVRRTPGAYRLTQWLQQGYATAVLANVGEVRRAFESSFPQKQGRAVAGNVTIRRIDGIAPLRKNTNIVMSIGTYGGELVLNLRQNPNLISDDEAIGFLTRLTERMVSMNEDLAPIHQECAITANGSN